MPTTDDMELPIRKNCVSGPAVDTFDNRKEAASSETRTEEQIFRDALDFLRENAEAIGRFEVEFFAGLGD